jgi:hypothetical protein
VILVTTWQRFNMISINELLISLRRIEFHQISF